MGEINFLCFYFFVFFLLVSVIWFSAPVFLIRLHEFLRKHFISETLVLWRRKRIAVLFLMLSCSFLLLFFKKQNISGRLFRKEEFSSEENMRKALDYFCRMDFESAAGLLEKVVVREPENAPALQRLGSVYWEMGRQYEAMILWESAISHGAGEPRFREFFYNMKKLQSQNKEEGDGERKEL